MNEYSDGKGRDCEGKGLDGESEGTTVWMDDVVELLLKVTHGFKVK